MIALVAVAPSVLPYLHDIRDLLSLSALSKAVRTAVLDTLTPPTLFTLLIQTRSLGPDVETTPWLLLAYVAPSISAWIGESSEHRREFKRSCPYAPASLLRLAVKYPSIPAKSGLDLAVLRKTWIQRQEILVSLTDLVDKCVGGQWYAMKDFWNGGREDAVTLYSEPNKAVLQMATYGELFGWSLEGWFESLVEAENASQPESLGTMGTEKHLDGQDRWFIPDQMRGAEVSVRCEFIKYAIPDWHTDVIHYSDGSPWGFTSSYPGSPIASTSGLSSEFEVYADDNDMNGVEVGCDGRAQNNQLTGDERPISGAEEGSIANGQNGDVYLAGENPAAADGEEPIASDRYRNTPLSNEHPYGSADIDLRGDFAEESICMEFGVRPGLIDAFVSRPVTPTLHPLRQLRRAGPYRSRDALGQTEAGTCLLHLLVISPLWSRVTGSIQDRVKDIVKKLGIDWASALGAAQDADDGGERLPIWERLFQLDRGERWKESLWDDALWTGGWTGLELIADTWEWHEENGPIPVLALA